MQYISLFDFYFVNEKPDLMLYGHTQAVYVRLGSTVQITCAKAILMRAEHFHIKAVFI
ncbi:hypothetical protein I79_001147 [Cricetulus griseus]|uniref:Uncharacterized protein n=1 Tax=Cricetulus griseus TaxID=10029 RepID=G3GU03_CRIGR|nr:hypothetical protein I79_001147 [Cricetulus griseus]